MMRGLGGKRVIVTGGGSGISGRFAAASVRRPRSRCSTSTPREAAETVALIENAGGRASAHKVDIADRAQVDAAVVAVEAGGPLDALDNNAGWDVIKPFLDTDPELWKKVIDINLCGPLHMHHAALPGMVGNGGGKVVNIVSDASRVGQPEDYPGIICFLCSDDVEYITGQVISVSGGLTMHG